MTAVTSSVLDYPRSDAILFDCDDMLVNSESIVSRLIQEILTELSVDISPEDSIQCFLDKIIREELDAIAEMRGAPLSLNWLPTSQARHNVSLEAEVGAVLHIGHVIDVLSRLGLPMAVAPGADRMKVELRLSRTDLIEHFQPVDVCIFSATGVACSKPASGVYPFAASSFEVSPSRCLVIEDSPTGVTTGHVAGMTVLVYAGRNAPGPLIAAGTTRALTDTRGLPELLA